MSDKYDVIVIGGGPGGYVAAIRCAQLGMKVACVEEWINKQDKPALGGTCLNVGCIPSKALLESSERVEEIQHHNADHGISVEGIKVDVPQMIARKDAIVSKLTGGIAQLFQANGIEWLQGRGKLLADKVVQVTGHDGAVTTHAAENVIIATGSVPIELPIAKWLDDRIVHSTGALNWETVPDRLGVIGAGVIGLEMGSVWRRLGAEVIVLEAMDDFLGAADADVSKSSKMQFKKQGLDIRLSTKVSAVEALDEGIKVSYTDKKGEDSLVVDRLIVAVGRKPNTNDIADSAAGLQLDERGRVAVDDHCATNLPGVYAIGDCVRGPMLAHKSSEEGVMVAEQLAGQKPHMDHNMIPWVIYTDPEIAWVGQTEAELKAAGVAYRSGSFSFAVNGRAMAMDKAAGLVKVLADASTDRILGVHIVGPMASELVGQAVIAMECEASSEDLARMCFAHPSLSESMHEAILSVDGRALHGVNRKPKK
ncbi:MAG: Dihydrolipoamide dehydrogenase of 2-oxoglutarate dehydrogenase (EC [uncultured Thiotrichaceae bacterium]|uniref:Dihydrolipoyl dehydrogenase n=1 Tax=uncultured Thiotrichaceae bacterium TaxID=298394 RepID=A0A6S6TFA0_9GAMM|nr:MAG: Dihydrolipoamide dehydrogenase of 2-oxoglutarate dehydrogenase (EC [uncultured Thiotrichaceae bacterium]